MCLSSAKHAGFTCALPFREVERHGAATPMKEAHAAAACAGELAAGSFLRRRPAPQLLLARCHQQAAAAFLRAGDVVGAYLHSQVGSGAVGQAPAAGRARPDTRTNASPAEVRTLTWARFVPLLVQDALGITCRLFGLLDEGRAAASGRPSGPEAASLQQPDPSAADAAAAAVQHGVELRPQDFAAESSDEEEAEDRVDGRSGSRAPEQGSGARHRRPPSPPVRVAGAADAGAAGGGQRSGSPARGVDAGLGCALLAAHLASLYTAAAVMEASGCAEDSAALGREAARLARALRVAAVAALGHCLLVELQCRREDLAAAESSLCEAEAAAADAGGGGGMDARVLRAQLCVARARVALLRGELGAAGEACEQGLAGSAEPEEADDARGGLAWQLASLRTRLGRTAAEALSRVGKLAEAVAVARATLEALETHAGGGGAAADVWPVDVGLSLSQQAALAAALLLPAGRPAADAGTTGGLEALVSVRVVGLGRSSAACGAGCSCGCGYARVSAGASCSFSGPGSSPLGDHTNHPPTNTNQPPTNHTNRPGEAGPEGRSVGVSGAGTPVQWLEHGGVVTGHAPQWGRNDSKGLLVGLLCRRAWQGRQGQGRQGGARRAVAADPGARRDRRNGRVWLCAGSGDLAPARSAAVLAAPTGRRARVPRAARDGGPAGAAVHRVCRTAASYRADVRAAGGHAGRHAGPQRSRAVAPRR